MAEQESGEEMITVSIRYHNMLLRRAGVEQETITLHEGTSLRAGLNHLADRHGPHLKQMLFSPQGDIVSHLVVFRNRKLVSRKQFDDPLSNGDELMLFPAIAGG